MNGRPKTTKQNDGSGVGDKGARWKRQPFAQHRVDAPTIYTLEQNGKEVGEARGHRPPSGSQLEWLGRTFGDGGVRSV